MKTIKQVADEVGITKQAVSKRIDNLGCRNELVLVGGQYQMSDEIAERIRDYSPTANHQPPTANRQPTANLVLDGGQCQTNDDISGQIQDCAPTANRQPTANHQPPTANLTVGGGVNTVNGNIDSIVNAVVDAVNGSNSDVNRVKEELSEAKIEIARLTERNLSLEQRLSDKDKQIEELRQLLGEQTRERQAYSAALITANTKLSEIRHLTLTDRLFGWGNVQAMLTDSSAADRNEKPTDIVDIDIKE